MASATDLKIIYENVLKCSICQSHLKRPKLLPCLHRFCRDCLQTLIKGLHKDVRCPECHQHFPVPKEGLDWFKTDFNVQNLLEFVRLIQSWVFESSRVCVRCKQHSKMTGYCFKCNDSLCQTCHDYHVNGTMFEDHRHHIYTRDKVGSLSLTLEKFSLLKEQPWCHNHSEKYSELCCESCNFVTICRACGSFGVHKGHILHEVTSFAKIERMKLSEKLTSLIQTKERILQMQHKMRQSKENLDSFVARKEEQLRREFEQEKQKIKCAIRNNYDKTERQKKMKIYKMQQRSSKFKETMASVAASEQQTNDLSGILPTKTSEEKATLEKPSLSDQLHEQHKQYKQELYDEIEKLNLQHKRATNKLYATLDILNKRYTKLMASLKVQVQQNSENIAHLSDHFEHILKRFENIISTVSIILAAKNDWTDVRSIPDTRSEIDVLIKEGQLEFPEIDSFSSITMERLLPAKCGDEECSAITEHTESVTSIEGIGAVWWTISGITGSENGSIVITGPVTFWQSYITVNNINCNTIRQNITKTSIVYGFRYCDFLSQYIVVIVTEPNEIGIYDIRNGSCITMKISNIVSSCPASRCARCITTDTTNNQIIVGCQDTRDVYVFDQLNYCHTLKLPDIVTYPRDISVSGGYLIVCDYLAGRALAVTMMGPACKPICELTKPDNDRRNWKPLSVCTDRHGLIYMLWVAGYNRRIIAQYCQNGRRLLTTRKVDGDAWCITTVVIGEIEKVLVATLSSRRLFTYGLVQNTL